MKKHHSLSEIGNYLATQVGYASEGESLADFITDLSAERRSQALQAEIIRQLTDIFELLRDFELLQAEIIRQLTDIFELLRDFELLKKSTPEVCPVSAGVMAMLRYGERYGERRVSLCSFYTLSTRARVVLQRAGSPTWEGVKRLGRRGLLNLKNCGRVTTEEIAALFLQETGETLT